MSEPILQFFKYDHLPAKAQEVSKPFCDLAHKIVGDSSAMPEGTSVQFPLPRNPERTVTLRKLLEAKDAAVRASFMVLIAVLLFLPSFAHATAFERAPMVFLGDVPAEVMAPAPSPLAAFFQQFITPTGIASAVVTLLGLVGGALGLTALRKRQIAIVTQHAFYGVLDFAKTTETPVDDKVAAGLMIANDWMIAQGWRPLSPQEATVVQLGFKALHGAEAGPAVLVGDVVPAALAEARQRAELASLKKTDELPVVPQGA